VCIKTRHYSNTTNDVEKTWVAVSRVLPCVSRSIRALTYNDSYVSAIMLTRERTRTNTANLNKKDTNGATSEST
jgi:hypothetical protein